MDCVQHVSISAVVGWEKPHGNIFAHALDAVGVSPARAVHVGDSLHADVHGARQAGMQPLWLRRDGEARRGTHDEGPVIHDLNGVLDWLARHDGIPSFAYDLNGEGLDWLEGAIRPSHFG